MQAVTQGATILVLMGWGADDKNTDAGSNASTFSQRNRATTSRLRCS
ncbi:hypothetical protein APY04_2817 [Hyphomicrobium sulfonivorans]|uniref:Uncharacterized protein n=1 Tax=Hyphomicrobium sulfonivorans TaxID=121290 RepID=A0A109BAU7_HYPSL|nr:hypothetical protein APY04_2817 [Hyphomicrobium sulfonivorans]